MPYLTLQFLRMACISDSNLSTPTTHTTTDAVYIGDVPKVGSAMMNLIVLHAVVYFFYSRE